MTAEEKPSMDFKKIWDDLHHQPKYRPAYPDDRVVAWTFRNFPRSAAAPLALLDVGCGAGRHALFFAREGFRSAACDFSAVGIEETGKRAQAAGLAVDTAVCEADDLSYPDASFDGVLVFGTFTYLPYDRFRRAVGEVRRVLRPGGKALVVSRSVRDSRVQGAERLGHATYRIADLGPGAPSNVEAGMVMTFLDEGDIREAFSGFSRVLPDRLTFTGGGGVFINDDWYIHAEK